ncbi:polymorphic toxin type 47 domain-containing protein [Paenibacillus taichungensis]|uniref:polymorphic toxin type 47 domain-containing protein n=1 Tax=Paenibacillus taichungensis TaxID=484184 RepID=UPI002DBE3D32|nr:polymorphic toxin type 47 domain-containing protein [Paenibacillus taichungensis]MEC0108162.1 polymorphic toxin type 47 domain-containing protein [Paenibacillus taichungensis]MEC0199792.1 polymorphic toxin type 47 domain-containing protein [Paenibacillus taichungensis]
MFKKLTIIWLCAILVLSGFGSFAYGGQAAAAAESRDSLPSATYITIHSLKEQFGIKEDWIERKLDQGYSLYQLYKALQTDRTGGEAAEKWLEAQEISEPIQMEGLRPSGSSQQNTFSINALGDDAPGTGTTVDETGLNHVDIRDDASLYMTSYGAESISTATGEMMIQSTDLSLPGLIPFDLTRVYDSARATGQLGVEYDETTQTYSNKVTPRKEELSAGLGQGWRWDIPFMEKRGDNQYILIPGVGYYRLNANLELEGYVWKDLSVKRDATVTVNGVSSSYRLSIRNGYDYLFNESGELLQITDGYRNTVNFHYTALNGNQAIARIENSEGQALTFAYDNLKVTIQLAGTDRKATYMQREDEGIRILREYTDALDRTTTYTYYYPESKFNFLPELQSNQNAQGVMHTALLSRITSPSSAITDYAYIPALKQIGEASSYFVFKVRERKSHFSTTEGEGVLDKVNFEYSGEDLDTYGQSATWTTKVKAENTVDTWTFSKTFSAAAHPDLVHADKHTLTGDDVIYSTELQYDNQTKRNLPTQMTEWVSEGGRAGEKLTTTMTYDANGMVTSEKQSTGQETTYAYETGKAPYNWIKPVRFTTKVNSTLERYTEITYNNQGHMLQTSTKNGYGGQLLTDSEVKIDDKGRISSSTDKGGMLAKDSTATFSYQSNAGHLLESTSTVVHDAIGKEESLVVSYSYTPSGELETTTNASGEQETIQYDKAGRLIQIKHADGTQSTTAYDDTNNIITSTSPDGIVTFDRYNPLGLLVEEQTADATYKYAYDGEGNVTASEDAEGNVTRYVVNAFGQTTETQYPDGTSDTTTIDPAGQTITVQDASGYKTREKKDLLGRTTAVEEYRDGAFVPLQQSEYDLSGNVTASIDGNGERTTYTYDALGQIATATTPKQETSRYFYSYQGQVTQVVFANGQTVTKHYDELGRIIKQTPPTLDGSATTFYYDKKSNLIKKQDRLGKITEYTYNSDNMLTGFKGPDTSVSYTYDEMGRRTSMADDHGKTTYSYRDTDGVLSGLAFPDGTKLEYENNTQQRLGYTLTDVNEQSLRIHGELDTMNRVTSMDITSGTGGASALAASAQTPVDRITFSYTSNSLLEKVSFGKGLSTSYQFDGYDLSGVTVSQGTTSIHQFDYEYDGNKNITSRTQNGTSDRFTYDELSRIQTESGSLQETYTYDSNGNRYSTGSGKVYGLKDAEYTYDSQNRLVKAAGEGKTVTYSYNGDGLLYERTEGDKTTRYYYDEEAKLMAEAQVTSGKTELTYAYIYDLYGQLWARQEKQTGKLEYYQFNGHGDVVGLVDDAGQVLNEYTYDIWGGPLTTEETVPNVLRYAGEYWDETTGLQYLRARWYDPGMARFIGEDTYEGELNDPLSLNLYSYVSNNPLKYVDPSGNMAEPYYAQELRHMLKDAKAKGYKINTSNYNLYKNTIRDRYGFNSFLDKNRYNYLYDMALGRSPYTKSAGNISWATEQLVSALIKGKEAEYIAALAMGLVPGAVGKTKAPALRYALKSQDLDWRGAGKSWRDAVDLAFRKTGVDKSEFTATKWAKDANGKSFPVEWRSKNGSEVSIDYSHYGVDRNGNWASGPDAPHVGWQTPGKKNTVGHIILDSVPFGRPPNK